MELLFKHAVVCMLSVAYDSFDIISPGELRIEVSYVYIY
jgi:hypothetical protein